ncbi:hypothetical protein ZIOFF_028386 [Zingiber officinale]|uniref:Uncharacterized protein n=1 Tax=Zingiber officinale TaxID=94328 RepID=A0A8J5GUZ2_ZINOF|nr:hypothetical protein ZIOFF_028386 [Zingiber officinale]
MMVFQAVQEIYGTMAPAQSLSDANEQGKSDVSVKSENKDFADTKEAVGFCSDNGEDGILCDGSLKDTARDVDVLDERKLNHILKSEKLVLVDDKDASGLLCTNKGEDVDYCVGSSTSLNKVDNDVDQEIDIVSCTEGIDSKTVNFDDPDATEYSSSFGDTFSGLKSEMKQENGDMEVDSPFVPSNGDPTGLDALNRDFRKKKVNAQWRKCISPLLWRCQWLELRMKQLFSQASMYDKELASYKHEKELQSKIIELDTSGSRSVPFPSRNNQKRVMKRRKRKRTEDKVDISSYMSNHVVFSYYENRRTDTDGHSVDDCGEGNAFCICSGFSDYDDNIIGNDDNEWLLGLKGGDGSLEQVLLNIESVQSRIVTLKTQLNNVMGRDVRARSDANLFLGDPPVSFLQNVTGGGTLSTRLPGTPPHHESECETEAVMPVSEGSSYGLLSAGDVTLDQHHRRDLCKDVRSLLSALCISCFLKHFNRKTGNPQGFQCPTQFCFRKLLVGHSYCSENHLFINLRREYLLIGFYLVWVQNEEDVLIDNQVAEEEYQNFENASHETDKLEDMEKSNSEIHSGNESTAPMVPVREASQPETNIEMPSQTVLKPCYTGKRRGRKPKKKKRQARLVAALPQPKSKKLHVSSSSRSSRAHTRGPSKTEKLLASSPKLWRSERLKLRRLAGKKT